MSLTFNTATYTIESTASITDLPAFHAALRDWEDSEQGAIHPVTHSWKALDLGGGGYFYQADLLSPWVLKFPNAGSYTISGNLNATVVPVAGVYVERKTSAAYITTAVGGSGPSASDIAAALLAALNATTIPTDVRKVNGDTIIGHGIPPTYDNTGTMTAPGDPWRPA